MPKKVYKITDFSKGVNSYAGSRDIPEGFSSDIINADVTKIGTLRVGRRFQPIPSQDVGDSRSAVSTNSNPALTRGVKGSDGRMRGTGSEQIVRFNVDGSNPDNGFEIEILTDPDDFPENSYP